MHLCSRTGLSFPATARWEGAVSPLWAGRSLVILLALAGPLMGADVLVAGLGVLVPLFGGGAADIAPWLKWYTRAAATRLLAPARPYYNLVFFIL